MPVRRKNWFKTFDGYALSKDNEQAMELLEQIDTIASDNRAGYHWKDTKQFLINMSIHDPYKLSDFLSAEPNVHDIINWAESLMDGYSSNTDMYSTNYF